MYLYWLWIKKPNSRFIGHIGTFEECQEVHEIEYSKFPAVITLQGDDRAWEFIQAGTWLLIEGANA